jgi:uncharacterized protein
MDKAEALRISRSYIEKVKVSDLNLSQAWLFGSYAIGNQTENSDIDIAIVLNDKGSHTFDAEIKLMLIRTGEETIIEPHAFTLDEFDVIEPMVYQITHFGERIELIQ